MCSMEQWIPLLTWCTFGIRLALQSTPLIENAVLELMTTEEYGNSRKWGAIGFGILSLIGGAIFPVVGFG